MSKSIQPMRPPLISLQVKAAIIGKKITAVPLD